MTTFRMVQNEKSRRRETTNQTNPKIERETQTEKESGRMGKGPFSFRRTSSRRRLKKAPEGPSPPAPPPPMMIEASLSPNNQTANTSIAAASGGGGGAGGKAKKKTGGARLWMRFDRCGQSELLECDKSTIIRRAAIPARDLRILGPVFSHSSNILGKEWLAVFWLRFVW